MNAAKQWIYQTPTTLTKPIEHGMEVIFWLLTFPAFFIGAETYSGSADTTYVGRHVQGIVFVMILWAVYFSIQLL